MTANAEFAIGTLAAWIGGFFALRAVVGCLQLLTTPPEDERRAIFSKLTASAVIAGLGFLVAALFLDFGHVGYKGDLPIPVVWFVMPFYGWATIACVAMGAWRFVQGFFGLNAEERIQRSLAGVVWLLVGGIFFSLWLKGGMEGSVLRGAIGLRTNTALALLALAVAAVLVMAWSGRRTRSRGHAKAIVTHATLLAGSVVFGLPFAFLLVTSFKEDQDMSSPEGIVWVPKVQVEVPYFDKERPLYEGEFEGQEVQGEIIERLPDGRLRIDIFKPMSMRGKTFSASLGELKEVPKMIPVVTMKVDGKTVEGHAFAEKEDGRKVVRITKPPEMAGKVIVAAPSDVEAVRVVGLKWRNYPDALDFLPPETNKGLVYLKNTLLIVVLSVIGTILSSAIVAYAFSRMRFPGKGALFLIMLSTMMLPAAVTLLPQFLIYTQLGWIDTLYPLWVPAFFASAFNVFLLRQFFMSVPMELEDAAKIDGSSYLNTFWNVMMPQIKPALAVIAIWTFMGAWNNFMGPLIYINSPENMPISYAVQLFSGDRANEPGLLMAFVTMAMLPVLALFFFAQKYFIEGVTLSGMGGR